MNTRRSNPDTHQNRQFEEQPANRNTMGNPNDPRWKTGDLLQRDNEKKKDGENDPKLDKTGR